MNKRIANMSLELKQALNRHLALGRFIENCRNMNPLDDSDLCSGGLYSDEANTTAYSASFSWTYSPEGFDYWNNLHPKLGNAVYASKK